MEEKKFVKDLNEDEKQEVLNFIIDSFEISSDPKLITELYKVLINYLSTLRRSIDTFERNVTEIIDLFTNCGYTNNQIIEILIKEPSLLHASKNDVFWRILILAKITDKKTGKNIRNELIIKNPRVLRTSQDITYARIKYLESKEASELLKNNDGLSARQVTKITHDEFENSYKISKEELIKKYPFDNEAQLDVVSWPLNEELLDSIYKRHI